MKRPRSLFSLMLLFSAILLALNMIENIGEALRSRESGRTRLAATTTEDAQAKIDLERKALERHGIKLHEGKYWQEGP